MRMKSVGLMFGVSMACTAHGAGNPFPAMEKKALGKIHSQSFSALQLTGPSFTPAPPKFRIKDGVVIYDETPSGDAQFNISRQKVFRSTGDNRYSFGESVFEGRVAAKYTMKEVAPEEKDQPEPLFNIGDDSKATALNPGMVAAYSPNFNYNDNWTIGDGWFGASMGYQLSGSRTGNSFSAASVRATVLAKSTLLLGASVQTSRDTKSTSTTTDDRLDYIINTFFLNAKTEVANSSIPIGGSKTYDELANVNSEFFKQQWQWGIGPVPILVSAYLKGKAGSGKPAVKFGETAVGANEVFFDGNIRPYASIIGGAKGVLGGIAGIPTDVLPAYVAAGADINLVEGTIVGRANGRSDAKGPCLYAGMESFRTMRGNLWVEAKWSLLNTIFVKSFVNVVCDNGYFAIPGCNTVQEFLEEVDQWTSYQKRDILLQHPGFDLGSGRKWLDVPSCQTAVEPTVMNLCSNNDQDIYAAMLFWDQANSFWQSAGWYRIPAKGCTPVSLGNYQQSSAYVYAMWDNHYVTWTGTTPVCVHKKDAFDINKADIDACADSEYMKVQMDKVTIVPNSAVTHTFGAADFSQYDKTEIEMCNSTSQDPINSALTFYNGAREWEVRGWFNLPKDQCRVHEIGRYQGTAYMHAYRDNIKWGRGWNWCTSLTLPYFEYPFNATMGCVGGTTNALRQFSPFEVKKGRNRYTFTDAWALKPKIMCNFADANSVWAVTAHDEKFIEGRTVQGGDGWYEVKKGECRELRLQNDSDSFWVYARNSAGKEYPPQDGTIGKQFCMHPSSVFNLTNLPTDCPDGMEKKYFKQNTGQVNFAFGPE